MNRISAVARITLGLMVAFASTAAAAVAPQSSVEHLTLDSYHNWNRNYTPPVSSDNRLAANSHYVATVSGTFSYYASKDYSSHPLAPWTIVCGTPNRSSMYPGSLGGYGPVGFDAEFVFSRPWTPKRCAKAHLPQRWPNFEANTGEGWSHPQILGALPTVPTSDHTYSFAIAGTGARVQFRLRDVWTRDNYGLLKISLRRATSADCTSFTAFGLADQASCGLALK
jgi:hypothetical protein